jgi:hypothetical protein
MLRDHPVTRRGHFLAMGALSQQSARRLMLP